MARYRARLSGPLLERIDLHVELPPVDPATLFANGCSEESSTTVAARVLAARRLQLARDGQLNSRLATGVLEAACGLGEAERKLLERALRGLGLSARSLHRLQRVARTVADLDASPRVRVDHLAEAIGYRRLDRGADSASA